LNLLTQVTTRKNTNQINFIMTFDHLYLLDYFIINQVKYDLIMVSISIDLWNSMKI
jgi:hypothetical protein